MKQAHDRGTFAEWLKTSGWSAAELARALTAEGLETSRSAVSAWATGKSRPTLDRVVALQRITKGAVKLAMFAT